MCGICGFYGFENKELLKRMTKAITHRGPDEEGYYFGNQASGIRSQIGLGHRRLAIIDLKTGHQPIYNENKKIWIVCNGEIYNHSELRENLIKKGHKFYTKTDVEVIVHSYEEKGEKCLEDFNGMFAFAIWDEKEKKLFLARDRLGIRPLYYTIVNNSLIFASEIKSILECKFIKREVDFEALDLYLSFRYVPGEKTLFKNIFKLLPAHYLIYRKNNIEIKKYWEFEIKEEGKRNEEEYIEEFSCLFENAVKIRLMGDVPVGAFLSGGIDSSGVLALMRRFVSKKIKTVSVGFGTSVDELNEARNVAKYFDCDHSEIIVKEEDFKLLPKIVWHLDEPLGDAIVIPMYLLSQTAKDYVKVAMTGEGGDELFSGYMHHLVLNYAEIYRKIVPNFFSQNIVKNLVKIAPTKLLNTFFPYPADLDRKGKDKIIQYLSQIGEEGKGYLSLLTLFNEDDKEKLYTEGFRSPIEKNSLIKDNIDMALGNKRIKEFLNRLITMDLNAWLPGNILFKQDKMMMANSLEGRVPYLDHRIVEFSAKIPANLKLRRLTTKYILRKSMDKILPKEVARRKKKAFYIPMEKCFKENFHEYIKEILSPQAIRKRGYFRYPFIEKIIKERENSPFVLNKQLMSLVILEIWHRIFIDGENYGF